MSASPAPFVYSSEEKEYADRVVEIVGQIVPGLARAFALRSEVVLHNLTKIPRSIEAIAGGITGRSIGGPPTDLGLRTFQSQVAHDLIGYRTEVEGGPEMRSSSLFFRAPSGRSVVALCINTDIEAWLRIEDLLRVVTGSSSHSSEAEQQHESFPATVDTLAQGILHDAIGATGVSVELMKKAHKKAVVRELGDRGFFTLSRAVDLAAAGLKVSRYSVYKYLNEIAEEAS